MFSFNFNILEYNDLKGYLVRYTPNDNDCIPITQWVHVGNAKNEAEVKQALCNAAPHQVWESHKNPIDFDYTLLVNTEHSYDPNTKEETTISFSKTLDNGEQKQINVVLNPKEL